MRQYNFAAAGIIGVICLAMGHGMIASAADVPAASPAQETTSPPQPLLIARWDALLNDIGLDAVKQANPQPLQTNCKLYQGMKFDAATLRAAIAQAKATKGVIGFDRNMAFSQNQGMGKLWLYPLNFIGYNFSQDTVAGIQGNIQGNETDESSDADHMHFKLDYPQFHLQILERSSNRRLSRQQGNQASIQYDGIPATGEAIGFLGDYAGSSGTLYHHLLIWEVFKAPENRANYFQLMGDPDWWCDNGPEGLNSVIDTAQVWAAGATHEPSQVKPAFEQKTEDGKTVRLLGLNRADKWPFCWWDGEGMPVNLSSQFQLSSYVIENPLWCCIEVTGDNSEWKMQTPTGNAGIYSQNSQSTMPYSAQQDMQSQDMKQVQVGIPVGPWIKVGDIAKGGSIDVDGVNYQLRQIQQNGDNSFYCQFNPNRYEKNPPSAVTLSAEAQDGTQLDSYFGQQTFSSNSGMSLPQFQGMSLDKMKTLHVWKRKIQWLTFDHLLAEPPTPPKVDVTPAEVAAAEANATKKQQELAQRQMQAQIEAQSAPRKEWEAIPADPSNANGALRALYEAAKKDDLKGVRQRLRGANDDENKYLDLYAQMITDQIFIRSTLVDRFTAAKINALLFTDPLFMPDTESMFFMNWQKQPNGDLSMGNMTVSKGPGGQYKLNVKINAPKGVTFDAQYKLILDRMEKIKKLLADNPTMTLDELDKAAQNALAVK